MKAFRAPMRELGEFEQICHALKEGKGLVQISGCIGSQKSQLIDSLGAGAKVRLILAENDLKGREIYENYKLFDRKVMYFPARDFIFFQADVHSNELEQQRMKVWRALACGEDCTIVMPVTACMNHLMPFGEWKKRIRLLESGMTFDLEFWKRELVELGYERTAQVETPGTFAVRGSIVDVFSLTEDNPIRIDLWGDEIDSIKSFDPASQRTIETLEEAYIYPARELVLTEGIVEKALKKIEAEAKAQETRFRDRAMNEEGHRTRLIAADCRDRLTGGIDGSGLDSFIDYFYPRTVSFLDALPENTLLFLDEPNRLMEAAEAAELEFVESMQQRLAKGYVLPGQTGLLYPARQVAAELSSRAGAALCGLDINKADWQIGRQFSLSVQGVSSYNSSFEMLVRELEKWKSRHYRVILLCASRTRGQRLAQDLTDLGVISFYSEDPERVLQPGEIMVTHGSAHRGYEYPLIRFAVLTDSDIFGKEPRKRRARQKRYEGIAISSFTELSVGDYVVHESHGLGVFCGIEKMEVDRVIKDYIKIEYAGGSHLYVPVTNLDVIQKYADSDAKKPKLNKLGGQEWTRTKSRVRGAVREIARELVELYAVRQKKEGFVYGPDTVWQREFEELFPFEETDDQLTAIEDTKKDMESTKIMDRLVCGDVGFGKTEVAIRAAFKAAQESKQVAYLAPTTILAQQHYNTFVQRMAGYPVNIELMCRFKTSAEQKKTAEKLAAGKVDIVIGTHRLLSKDVKFKDLGLLIVDEEQRFGVTHKEKIKQMKKNVDVLTLTATPIPRTLHMSLIGIRDMSVLEEAPQDRTPIQTFVMEYNEELVREAISRELARNGQVYYVYNRVNTIMDMTDRLQKLMPQARIAYAHGQMKERELEDIMVDFINGEIDVLVTTTIIETGLDIANANTMIIHDADTLGLSQLYQLRGRIGRSTRTSYAFLMYRRNKVLREVAEKRLAAIREFTELGSGFKIAMRDLEIRGAGNLLGSEQHGHMEAVGYDLYCKMLNESVLEAKGERPVQEEFETSFDVVLDAYIPDRYISNENQKLDIYKRISGIQGQEDYDDILDELIDRFGEPPKSVMNLMLVAKLRALAHSVYLTAVEQKGDELRFLFYAKARIDASRIGEFTRQWHGRMSFRAAGTPGLYYALKKTSGVVSENAMDRIGEVLEKMQVLVLPE
ncbi:MAG: transcription-repair coupling factor [Lachnospiraceae bacterium]|nr:transcription-repair coupling factor [Lachnospiraceae bacterium]